MSVSVCPCTGQLQFVLSSHSLSPICPPSFLCMHPFIHIVVSSSSSSFFFLQFTITRRELQKAKRLKRKMMRMKFEWGLHFRTAAHQIFGSHLRRAGMSFDPSDDCRQKLKLTPMQAILIDRAAAERAADGGGT